MSDQKVVSAKDIPLEDLYLLMKKVYQVSDAFSEAFNNKYPSLSDLGNEIEKSRNQCYVSIQENKPSGFLFLSPQIDSNLKHTAYFSMGVDKNFQGKGIGSQLLAHMIEHKDPSIEIIYLMVRADNAGAIKLYEKLDFKKVATLTNDTKIGQKYYDGLLMSRSWI